MSLDAYWRMYDHTLQRIRSERPSTFIGVKLILEALHLNELPFINGGHHISWAPEIPIWLSLLVIIGTLTITTVASLAKTRRDARNDTEQPDQTPPLTPVV